ncbi:MAG: phosphatase PAP2 family protein [Salinicola sp.]|uniref:phosphatase PAP2 family protein n=1 Tax=Salinicola sp. TaxID=1978524 RepID=UPI001D8F7037|nr:phosphatase PAP2 family protein [Salinicola sp.]NRB55006.1 phosphatase PAP2 family protein [Salinicola sp.]
MLVITEMGDGFVTTALTLAVATWLLINRAWYSALYWVVAVGGASLFTPGIKAWVQWPRPTAHLYSGWELFSFPSGHATINAVLYGSLAYLVARSIHARGRRWIAGAACLIVFMIAFSRIYLGAHWFADVIAGMSLGTAWIILLALLHQRYETQKIGARGLMIVFLTTLAIAWPYHVTHQLGHDRSRYSPQLSAKKATWEDWLNGAAREITVKRIDLAGETEEPLALQWAGDLSSLRSALELDGWQINTPWSINNTLAWLDPQTSAALLPILPRLNEGHPPVLNASSVVAGKPSQRVVLQVWPTLVELGCGSADIPLWAGSLRVQQRTSILGLVALERDRKNASLAQSALLNALRRDSEVKVRQLMGSDGFNILAGYDSGREACGDA